jgi:predicted transcriptional regulator
MELQAVVSLLDAEVVSRQRDLWQVVSAGAGADLMSDVLAFAQPDSLLLTGLTNLQVVRTAEMAGIQAIVFVRGKVPPEETIRLAEETGIPLLRTRYTMYEACGRLYQAGLPSAGLCDE